MSGKVSELDRADPTFALWLAHKPRVRDYIAKRVGERDAVDDIVQEVFLKAQLALHTVKSKGSFAAWLFRIAANAIADHYRRQKPSEELPDEFAAPASESDVVDELAVCVQPMIARLPETYRAPLVMSEIDGLTQKEVARRLGLSLSGAKSRIQRGREKLRQRFEECCDIEIDNGRIVGYEARDRTCVHP
jgi:RNA polymerase sigma-70 factor (ECF subfamily)